MNENQSQAQTEPTDEELDRRLAAAVRQLERSVCGDK